MTEFSFLSEIFSTFSELMCVQKNKVIVIVVLFGVIILYIIALHYQAFI